MNHANCYECKYRGNVPGDAHSCCRYPGNDTTISWFFSKDNAKNKDKLNIQADLHEITVGRLFWPQNYDPAWLLNCDGFAKKEEKGHENQED